MQRLLSAVGAQFTLALSFLSLLAFLLPADLSLSWAPEPTLASPQAEAGATDWSCEDTSADSDDLGCQCKQGSKQPSALTPSCAPFARGQEREERLASAPPPVFLPVCFRVPRKLLPASPSDEPFLS